MVGSLHRRSAHPDAPLTDCNEHRLTIREGDIARRLVGEALKRLLAESFEAEKLPSSHRRDGAGTEAFVHNLEHADLEEMLFALAACGYRAEITVDPMMPKDVDERIQITLAPLGSAYA